MRRYRWIIPVIILLLAGLITLTLKVQRGDQTPEGKLEASGTIEVTDVRVGFRMPGTLLQRPVEEGDRVVKGQHIGALDDREIQARMQEVAAEVRVARATLEELESGFRPEEIAQAEAAVREAEVQARNHASEAKRSRFLFAEGGASREQRDRDVTTALASASRLQAAKEKLELLQNGHRKEKIAAARARHEQALAMMETLRVTLDDMRVSSPFDGVVLRTHAEVGEVLAAARPVATIADLSKPRLRVYVPEHHIGRIRLGANAEIMVDAFPERRFPGSVSFISSEAEFTPKNVQTREERVKLVFAVDIQLDNPDGILNPGMPADAWIELYNEKGVDNE
ncbi:MAG: efflux RND transporter periplasmic adaptor subunit [Gammaproteobacteria bacterium]|nr:efflux RND transporter periplasmic adaptor subunit [Gammaproteobacteria bacterium]MCW8972456.1 efflux RND transporter periplasmic adaptor subunit [Gammaproteobacteria bacterium]MCW8992194.1 efflux RND transporter periplasmic adaptor subunit [Gammaproteobacteria bacterium]